MSTWAHDQSSLPDLPYLRAASAHSVAVQLYLSSGQLPTADILVERGKLSSDRHRLGCDEVEDMHHVFVYCKVYREWREEPEASVVEWTKKRLATLEVEEIVVNNLLKSAKLIFTDDPSVWPLQKTLFYLGQLLKADPLISLGSIEPGEVF